jgi:hypothetical protein
MFRRSPAARVLPAGRPDPSAARAADHRKSAYAAAVPDNQRIARQLRGRSRRDSRDSGRRSRRGADQDRPRPAASGIARLRTVRAAWARSPDRRRASDSPRRRLRVRYRGKTAPGTGSTGRRHRAASPLLRNTAENGAGTAAEQPPPPLFPAGTPICIPFATAPQLSPGRIRTGMQPDSAPASTIRPSPRGLLAGPVTPVAAHRLRLLQPMRSVPRRKAPRLRPADPGIPAAGTRWTAPQSEPAGRNRRPDWIRTQDRPRRRAWAHSLAGALLGDLIPGTGQGPAVKRLAPPEGLHASRARR